MGITVLLDQGKSLFQRWQKIEPLTELSEGLPACVLFFSISNGQNKASVHIARGNSFDDAWKTGEEWCYAWASDQETPPVWLRIDAVASVEAYSWAEQKRRMSLTKRNYFRFGLAFDKNFSIAFLEQELAANAILYDGQIGVATPNATNLAHYSRQRFSQSLEWPTENDTTLWRFKTRAVFVDGDTAYQIEHLGRHSGYRKVEDWGPARVNSTIRASTQYLATQVRGTGQYHYGWFPCFDRAIPTYNALRHASSTYALLEGWEVARQPEQRQAIERALHYLTTTLIHPVKLPTGEKAAFLVDVGNEIKLGGNAVCLLALVKYTELTGDQQYLSLLEQLAVGMLFMQDAETGSFVHVLNYPDLSIKAKHRIIYYDGEAAFGLMRLYGLTQDARWLSTVEKAFGYFIEAKHCNAHDHWLSYCVNELTLYKPELRYYQFGLDNVRNYLDFVQNRITTFPTLLELMMVAQRMIVRMQTDKNPEVRALLNGFPLEKFYLALESRARSLLDGFFWPELAMYFKNPARILDSFFIRHHSFRVRIDDVEHYLSGYVAYKKYLQIATDTVKKKLKNQSLVEPPSINAATRVSIIGLLSYPKSPRRFMEVKALASQAWSKGVAIFYISYQDFDERNGLIKGYLFDGNSWQEGYGKVPRVIDNAPANTRAQQHIATSLSNRARLLCHRLGGKAITLEILKKHPRTAKFVIESENLTLNTLSHMLDTYGSVVIKPYRSNRGKQVYKFSKQNTNQYTLESDTGIESCSLEGLENFCKGKPSHSWMIQRYVSSRSIQNKPFDIRVPVFRAKLGEWVVARKYARVGLGSLTSNLATGGSSHEALDFLQETYSEQEALVIDQKMTQAAIDIVNVLQQNYQFDIDALGCDFGIQNGELFLFEVNSYPGLKGCLESAVMLKTDFYQYVLQQNTNKRIEIKIEAATTENQSLLRKIMLAGENDYASSRYLRKGIANPIYHMLSYEARKQGLIAKLRKNSCLEIHEAHAVVAIFSPNSPNLSLATRRIANNKELSKFFLQRAGIAVPEGRVFRTFKAAQLYFKTRTSPQVVKPRTGTGGKGVTAHVTDSTLLKQAWLNAKARTSGDIIVEDFVVGDEVRIFVLGGKVTAAVCRIPAYVIGDGHSSIAALVAKKNEERKRNPLLKVYPIANYDYLTHVLKKDTRFIPKAGEYIRLAMVSNVALGGESVSVLKFLHPSILNMAEKVWKAIPHATQLGLDVIAKDFQAPAQNNAYVIEINADPAVATPAFSAYGEDFLDLPKALITYAVKARGHQKKLNTPILKAAAPYMPTCQGETFLALSPAARQTHLLRHAAYVRGLDVSIVDNSVTIIRDAEREITFVNGICGLTRSATAQALKNKQWMKELWSEAGLNTAAGQSFAVEDVEKAWQFVSTLSTPVVLKSISDEGTVCVSSNERAQFEIAWNRFRVKNTKTILCEQWHKGKSYRLLVIGNRLCAVEETLDLPITGDNQPHSNGHAEKMYDVTTLAHPEWADVAVQARFALYDPIHLGIQLRADNITLSPKQQNWVLVGANNRIEWGQSFWPTSQARDVAGAILEQVFKVVENSHTIVKRVLITGKVQGVGFRKWFWRHAHLHGIWGWVANRSDGRVEAIIQGHPRAIEQLIDKSKVGPTQAQVTSVDVFDECVQPLTMTGFEITEDRTVERA
ncbi:YheC/YheD family protein [Paenalcaligenes sp. Me131]|uniref:YheC/YheD family protein n=1 Tax=Paenalcaligenes sp. Me131 TaxID=3392636 RepID=UPI003D2C3DA0